MTDPSKKPEREEGEQAPAESANLQDLVGGLDFVPGWAKGDASTTVPGHFREERPPRRPGVGRRGRDEQRDGNRRGGNDRRPRGGPDSRPDRRERGPRDQRPDRRGGPDRRDQAPRLPVEVSFIPDRERLGAVVKLLHGVGRAFPLPYVAGLFLQKPEHYLVKLEAKQAEGREPVQFFQDRKTRAVFLSEAALMDYIVRTHLEEHFERVEIEMEPPSGHFVCVGRCRRSGILLGPPNYHGYNERMQEVHRSRFPGMSFDEYRNNIEMVRDPDVIEKWKDGCRRKSVYRPKDTPDAEPTLSLAQAERKFNEEYAASYVLTGSKAILPATLMPQIEDHALLACIRAARIREERFPLSLMLALRPAFRRMRLNLVKAGRNETYVTHAAPKALDAEHAVPEIRRLVEVITSHPGCNRRKLIEELFPGKQPDDPEVTAGLDSLVWLIDKGHIIEFFNGTYAIPGHLRDPGVVPGEMPQAHHHAETRKPAPVVVKQQPAPGPEEALPDDSSQAEPVQTDEGGEAAPVAVEEPVPESANDAAERPVDEVSDDSGSGTAVAVESEAAEAVEAAELEEEAKPVGDQPPTA